MRIWISAGEVSGDRLAARLVEALGRRRSDLEFAGIAGARMKVAGVRAVASSSAFSLAGWSSVLPRLPFLVAKIQWIRSRASRFAPDLAIVVDSPGLHAPFVRAFRHAGIRCVWLAPPQMWAWKRRAVPELRGLECFPLHRFEIDALEFSGAQALWYGFPGERPRANAGGDAADRNTLALFPGSRASWKARHLDLFRTASSRAGLPLRTVVAVPDEAVPSAGEERVSRLLPRTALALALPGTGVFEAAMAGVPVVVAARPGRVDRFLASSRLVEGDLSLPNRILGTRVFPEHLGNPSADELAESLGQLWSRRLEVSRSLEDLPNLLGETDACDRIAERLLEPGGGNG